MHKNPLGSQFKRDKKLAQSINNKLSKAFGVFLPEVEKYTKAYKK